MRIQLTVILARVSVYKGRERRTATTKTRSSQQRREKGYNEAAIHSAYSASRDAEIRREEDDHAEEI